jgi:hypothetical protein
MSLFSNYPNGKPFLLLGGRNPAGDPLEMRVDAMHDGLRSDRASIQSRRDRNKTVVIKVTALAHVR